MLDQVLETFKVVPNYDLNIMGKSQTLLEITTKILDKLDPIIKKKSQIWYWFMEIQQLLCYQFSCFYNQVRIGHVEAGLRTFDKYSPFPEEMNRQMTDNLADLYFAPTGESKANLLKENHSDSSIVVTGNTAIDALKLTVQEDYHHEVLDRLIQPKN